MNEVIIYLLKVMSIHGLLYLLYRLVLRNSGHHAFNRGYLLLAILSAFFIPFIEIPVSESPQISDEISVIMWLSEPAVGIEEFDLVPVQKGTTNSYWYLLPWFYATIVLILLLRSVFYLALLARLKRHSEYIKKHWFKLFKISQDRPFSFFSNVFMPKSLFGTDAFEQILAHECEHVRRYHSIDRLLMDFVVSLFWFNPFIYLYRNALIEIHEFQADEVVLDRFKDPVGYQEILFSQLQSAQYSGLVSHFNFSMIKKRIVMMNKKQKRSGWVYLLTLPVLFSVIFAFSGKESRTPIDEVGSEIADMLGPINVMGIPDFDFIAKQADQDSNEPSIMPVRSKDLVRLSSGFGMRMHPIQKVRKMHLGADFACKVGSEIIATADGVVEKVETKTGGYGKLLVINHENGFKTRYAQLSEFKVKQGDRVKKGDLIALSGNSGASTAPHLHYEIQKGDKRVDPMDYITDFKPKPVIKEIKVEDGKKKEQELAQQQMILAKQEAERAEVARIQAVKVEIVAKEEQQQAIQRQKEAEEKALIEEKIQREKLRFEDEKQDGYDTRFKIKGKRGDQSPLFVLDGEIIKNVDDLSPDDIESINVLKGESAKKLYGEKGKDGVIEITTKSKKKNKSKNKSKDKSKDDGLELSKAQIIKTQKALAASGYFKPFRVMIDPGHGGKDPGTKSPDGLEEKEIALTVSKMVAKYFEGRKDIEVIFTRDDDEYKDLKERAHATKDVDLLVSIHVDFDENPSEKYTSIFVSPENSHLDKSLEVSQALEKEFSERMRKNKVGLADVYLMWAAECPAVHVSLGHLSNQEDTSYLNSMEGQAELSEGIARAIEFSAKSSG